MKITNNCSLFFMVISLPSLLLLLLIFKPCIISPCYANQDRSLYIVLVEGDSLAFLLDHKPSHVETRFHPNRLVFVWLSMFMLIRVAYCMKIWTQNTLFFFKNCAWSKNNMLHIILIIRPASLSEWETFV